MDVNTRLLREFIVEKFSVEDFLSFLFDYFPQVYNEITPEMRQGTRIQLLLEHCHNYGRFPDLLANLERERPGAFHPKDFSNTPIPKPVSQIEKKTPYQRNPRQIFISHASQDAAIAGQLAGDLKRHGWEIWMAPNSIYPGEKWVEAINRGLAESGVFVLVLTETAVSSRWVRSETNVAIGLEHRNELRFLPLEFGEAAAPPLWEGYQWISFREDYKAGLENLLTLLQPEVMTQLNQLYRQMQQAFGNHDWNLVQTLGNQINDSYPDYREAPQLVTLAREEAKRDAIQQEELTRQYAQLETAVHAQTWDVAEKVIRQIEEQDANYRDVPKLAKLVQKERRKQREAAWKQQFAKVKHLPRWMWAVLLIVPVVVAVFLWVNRFQGTNNSLTLTVTAQSISLLQMQNEGRQVDEEPESFAVVTTVATNTSTPENASNFADKADATVTKTATSTISPTETSTKSPTPTTTATRTPRPSQTPEPTDTPTALPTAVFIASSATPVPQAATTSLRTPDVYPGDVSLSINPSGSQFSSGTNFRICVGMEGIDFNKAGVTAIGGYRIVENDTIGDFITLFNYNASSPLQNGCTGNDITFTNSGFYEVWGFVCTNEYDCTGGEGWESSEPILITITE